MSWELSFIAEDDFTNHVLLHIMASRKWQEMSPKRWMKILCAEFMSMQNDSHIHRLFPQIDGDGNG